MTRFYADKRWSVTLFCRFEFRSFPWDTQKCKFRQAFESTLDAVNLFLFPPSFTSYTVNVSRPTMDWEYKGSGFEIIITPIGTHVDPDTIMQNSTGEFGFDITLRRIIQPYIFQYYFPCAAIVIISQISFTIP